MQDSPGSSDGVNLVEKDEAGLLGPRHLKELSHHPCALAHVPAKNDNVGTVPIFKTQSIEDIVAPAC